MIQTSARHAETDAHYKAPDVAGYGEVPHGEKVRLFEQVKVTFGSPITSLAAMSAASVSRPARPPSSTTSARAASLRRPRARTWT
jgi:hypothetical protein